MSEGITEIVLTRQDLYDKVWLKPVSELAKELQISDVAIGKICKKLNVPKPPVGYWQKLKFGYGMKITPLPPVVKGGETEVTVSLFKNQPTSGWLSERVSEQIANEKRPENRIVVSKTLRDPHQFIVETRKFLEGQKEGRYNRLEIPRDSTCLSIQVSANLIARSLRIMDALIKAMESRGYKVEVTKEWLPLTKVIIGETKVQVRLLEKVRREENEGSEEEKRSWRFERYKYISTGILSFEVEEYWADRCQKKWSDAPDALLEDQLNEVVVGLYTIAEAVRLKKIEREKEDQQRKDEQLRREKAEQEKKAEEERLKTLERQFELWMRSNNLKTFIAECEKSLIDRHGSLAPGSPEAQWLQWARKHADNLDPIRNGFLEEAIQFRKKLL